MPVANFINFGKGDAAKYEVKLADSQYNADKLEAQTVTGDASISVDAEFVNNKTPHATVVSYNYGLVSSKKDADGNFIPVKSKLLISTQYTAASTRRKFILGIGLLTTK